MIFYGVRGNSLPIAELGSRPCPHCGAWHEFRAHVSYTFLHLYWAFGFVVKRKYLIACDHCDRGTMVRRDEIPGVLGDDPIPLLHRWGFVLMLLLTLGAIGALIVSTRNDF
ncbi:hypothetical protein DYQ86_26505 [Acidobacteria bacterium AB60]|nr:hypothetical protein DYQ86_26505 [Acidobacteria bacterium AB60]